MPLRVSAAVPLPGICLYTLHFTGPNCGPLNGAGSFPLAFLPTIRRDEGGVRIVVSRGDGNHYIAVDGGSSGPNARARYPASHALSIKYKA